MRALIVAVVVSSPAFAQSGFEGTWKMNTATARMEETTSFAVAGGMFSCSTCVPKVNIKADGKPHPIPGSPYSDSGTARAVSDNALETERLKAGKVVGTNKHTVSDDGKTLTTEWTFTAQNGQQLSGKYDSQRLGDVPASGSRISGNWKAQKVSSASDNALTFTFKSTDGGLEMSDPTGDSYSAKFDGKKYAYKGDPGVTHVVLKKIDDKSFEETDLRKGKVISVTRFTVGADGKTLDVSFDDQLNHAKGSWTADKQ